MLKKVLKISLTIIIFLVVLIIILLAASLRKVDRQPFKEANYYKETLKNLDKLEKILPPPVGKNLQVGTGKAGITPPVGVPLAGYGARKGAPSKGVHDSLFARAIAVQSGEKTVCLLGLDALIFNPPLARILEDSAKSKFGLDADQILFTATHTHSGPGGWGNGFVEEQFSGQPDSRVPAIFIDSTLVAIGRALKDRKPAQSISGSVDAPDYIRNRLVGDKGETDPAVVYLAFLRDNKIAALFATFSAHATVLSSHNMLFSGDYPGYFEREIESAISGPAIFAAAGLGSQTNRGKGEGFKKAEYIGVGLADSVLAHLQIKDAEPRVTLRYFRLPIKMHDLQVRITQNIRLAPWLAGRIFHINKAYMQVIALDHFVIIGSPGEFSGELALQVKEHARQKGDLVTVTSFNGCYLGYVTPSQYYHLSTYETKLMSWFGPYTGDYFVDIMDRIVDDLDK